MVLVRERRGNVELLTLNRPDARNAFDAPLSVAVYDAFEEIEADASARAVVITGSGEKAFSAGADLKEMARGGPDGERRASLVDVCRRGLSKPLIAAVNGSCLAGGLELALTCDLIVSIPDAMFGLPETKRGLVAGAGGVTRLSQRIGMAPALEIIMTGDPIDASRALELGLINRIVEREDLLPAALELAERIAANAPVAVQRSKQLVHEAIGADEEQVWELNTRALRDILRTEDAREGPRAFAEKRAPEWKGR